MKAAVIQYNIHSGDAKANRGKAAALLAEAGKMGAEIVLLPELWNCGYDLDRLEELAETSRGLSAKMLQKAAKEQHMFIIGGSIAEKKDGKYYNTSLAINQKGEIVQKYRKAHLFSLGLHEDEYFMAGDEWVQAETPWCKVGMMICYDLRFPEFARNLALRGAKLLTMPSQWPRSRDEARYILCRARAIENRCFVMAANPVGIDEGNGFKYAGGSMIIDPYGKILVEGPDEEGVFMADIDFSPWLSLDDQSPTIDVFADRRAILDEIDDSQI